MTLKIYLMKQTKQKCFYSFPVLPDPTEILLIYPRDYIIFFFFNSKLLKRNLKPDIMNSSSSKKTYSNTVNNQKENEQIRLLSTIITVK